MGPDAIPEPLPGHVLYTIILCTIYITRDRPGPDAASSSYYLYTGCMIYIIIMYGIYKTIRWRNHNSERQAETPKRDRKRTDSLPLAISSPDQDRTRAPDRRADTAGPDRLAWTLGRRLSLRTLPAWPAFIPSGAWTLRRLSCLRILHAFPVNRRAWTIGHIIRLPCVYGSTIYTRLPLPFSFFRTFSRFSIGNGTGRGNGKHR